MNKKNHIKTLVACALLVALCVVLKRFLEIQVPLFGAKGQSINFSFVIILFSGFLFGPVWGGLVGACSDLLSCVLVNQGAIIIGITATNFAVGALGGLFSMIFKEKRSKPLYLTGLCLVVSLLSSLSNSFWIWFTYSGINANATYLAYALPRLAFSLCILFPVNTLLLYLLTNKAVPILKRERLIEQK